MRYLKSVREPPPPAPAQKMRRTAVVGCLLIYCSYILLCVLNLPWKTCGWKLQLLFFSLSPSHTDHIVLFTNHIAGFAVSFEVGTLEGGPEVRVGGS